MPKRKSKFSEAATQARIAKQTGLKEKFQSYLSGYVEKHDDASAERIAQAFLAENPALLKEYAEAFVADLVRQRELWPRSVR